MPPRRKKSPNVYPLANGRWQARLWRGGQLHKVTFDTRAEAEQYRDAIDLDWRLRSRGLAGIVRRRPALLDLIASFLEAAESRELAPATLDYYRFTLAGWEKFVSEVLRRPALAAADVDDRLIARYAAWRLSRPLSDHAHRPPSEVQIAKDLTSLRAVFRHGGETVRWHPPRRLRRRGDGKRVISPEERGRWLAAMPVGSLERTYAELLANTGMRPSDAAALRRDQIDREACVIRFRAQKTGREQAVPISASLQRHLEAWLRAAPEGPDGRLFHLDGRAPRHKYAPARNCIKRSDKPRINTSAARSVYRKGNAASLRRRAGEAISGGGPSDDAGDVAVAVGGDLDRVGAAFADEALAGAGGGAVGDLDACRDVGRGDWFLRLPGDLDEEVVDEVGQVALVDWLDAERRELPPEVFFDLAGGRGWGWKERGLTLSSGCQGDGSPSAPGGGARRAAGRNGSRPRRPGHGA